MYILYIQTPYPFLPGKHVSSLTNFLQRKLMNLGFFNGTVLKNSGSEASLQFKDDFSTYSHTVILDKLHNLRASNSLPVKQA